MSLVRKKQLFLAFINLLVWFSTWWFKGIDKLIMALAELYVPRDRFILLNTWLSLKTIIIKSIVISKLSLNDKHTITDTYALISSLLDDAVAVERAYYAIIREITNEMHSTDTQESESGSQDQGSQI